MKIKSCPLCHERMYSEIGKGCKMCGMFLEDKSKDFCSQICREKYKEIRNAGNNYFGW